MWPPSAGADWSPGQVSRVPLSCSLPLGALQLGAPPREGCHSEPLALPGTCRHQSWKCLREPWDWGTSHTSAPGRPSLADISGILSPMLASLTLRPKGNWDVGFGGSGFGFKEEEGGNHWLGLQKGPSPHLQNCISSYVSGFPQLLKGSKIKVQCPRISLPP